MKERGQVTIFIILGIIIVIIIGLVYFLRIRGEEENAIDESDERFVSSQIEPIKTLVSECVKAESLKGLRLIGKQGGYYKPIKYEVVGDYNIAYGCYIRNGERINNLPLLEDVSKEFDDYMASDATKEGIDKCINNFKFFEDKGLDINAGSILIKSNIQFNKVGTTIQYPITISKGPYSSNVDQMSIDTSIGLGKLHKVASDIINDECTGINFDIDNYIKNNEPLSTIGMQYYNGKTFVYLSSITEGGEEPLDFHFVLENA